MILSLTMHFYKSVALLTRRNKLHILVVYGVPNNSGILDGLAVIRSDLVISFIVVSSYQCPIHGYILNTKKK